MARSLIPPFSDAIQNERKGVFRKITRFYKLEPEPFDADVPAPELVTDVRTEEMKCIVPENIDHFLAGGDWRKRCTECATYSSMILKPAETAELDKAARDLMMLYAHGFYLRSSVFALYTGNREIKRVFDQPYHNYQGAQDIMELYFSHLNRETLSRMHAFGFSERSTLSMCNYIIANVVRVYNACGPDGSAYVAPHPLKATTDSEVRDRIERIFLHGHKKAEAILSRYRESKEQTFPGKGS